MNRERFGLAAALATPFAIDGSIDVPRLVRHARWCLDHNCARVTLFGTTGEGASIDEDERRPVWQALEAAGIGGRQLVGGVAASTLSSAIRQAAQAYGYGAHAILLTPPYYFKGVDDEGLFRWFATLIETLGGQARNLLLYNIPSVTSITLSLPLITRLATQFPGIVMGVKDSSGNWPYTEALLSAHSNDLTILVGDERHLARAVNLGGAGAISGLANICPATMHPLAHDGREDPCVTKLVDEICRFPVIPAVKALIALKTGEDAWANVRPPLLPMPEPATYALRGLLDSVLATEAAGKAA